ncbi:DUF4265 domain-containing protein [Kitasatospora sp. NPDC059571]|uniref:DUF4265 domain-containing protein n=1 Tax=Kitasatospora sp. NPDC059571 TaxID=3346871 RepID=UPI0036862DC0
MFEELPAVLLEPGLFELAGSPGPALGCAAGDVLQVDEDGRFEVVEQGDHLCVQAYWQGDFTPESFADLRRAAAELGGLAEAPPGLRFAVVTVGRSVGPVAIERVLDAWAARRDGVEWWFGNGDDEDTAG